MVDFETRVFAGTPVTFAKIPGDPVRFVPLQYSLMPFPVRFSRTTFHFYFYFFESEYLIFVSKQNGTKDGERSTGQRPSRDSFFFDLEVKLNARAFFSRIYPLALTFYSLSRILKQISRNLFARVSSNDISREVVNEPAPKFPSSSAQNPRVDAFRRLPNVHLTRPQVQYGTNNAFVPTMMPSNAGMMMMMAPPLPAGLTHTKSSVKKEEEEEEEKEGRSGGQNSQRSGFDSFQEDAGDDFREDEQSKLLTKKRKTMMTHNEINAIVERPETPFMNSPSAAADVLMSLCGDGDGGGLFAAPAAARPSTAHRQHRKRNSNAETTKCTGQVIPLNLKCPRRKRSSLLKNMRRSSSVSSLEEDNGGENGAVVLHGITATTTGKSRQDNSLKAAATTTTSRVNEDNKASTQQQQQQQHNTTTTATTTTTTTTTITTTNNTTHNISGTTNGKNKRQKVHRPWSLVEVKALVAGVKRCGRGQWADIKSLADENISGALLQRSAVDLKDKWRNVMRTALSPVLYKKREATEIPENMLEDIRLLATAKEKEMLAANNASAATAAHTANTAGIRSPSTSGDRNDSNTNEDGEDDTFVANNNAESSQQKNTPLVERNTIVVSKSDEKQQHHVPYVQGHRRSKHHSPWTLEESQALVDGVRLCGGCRWTAIKKRDEADAIEKKTLKRLGRRTAMDLKDKWRNLLQLANLPTQSRRKRETPMSLLADVLELEKKFGDTRRRGRRTVATNNNTKKSATHEQPVATIVPTN
jgi:hypothetical protein